MRQLAEKHAREYGWYDGKQVVLENPGERLRQFRELGFEYKGREWGLYYKLCCDACRRIYGS